MARNLAEETSQMARGEIDKQREEQTAGLAQANHELRVELAECRRTEAVAAHPLLPDKLDSLHAIKDRITAVALTREHRAQGLMINWVADAEKEGTRRGRDHTPRTQLRELSVFLNRQRVPGDRAHGVHVQRAYARSP